MAAPKFSYVQCVNGSAGLTGWASGNAVTFSSPSSGDLLSNLTAYADFANVNTAEGVQTSNAWSAAHPVQVGQNSYEFVWGLMVTSPATNSLSNFQVYNNGAYTSGSITGVMVKMGSVLASGYTAPVTTASSIANHEVDFYTSGSPLAPTTPANATNSLSDPVYMQLQTQSQAAGGNLSSMPVLSVVISWA